MSALALMAANENRWLKLGADDVVIMSSHPIPGNEANVSKVIDGLVRLGAEVVHSGIEDVHATGHAKQEELKTVPLDRPARLVHPGARRVPPPGGPRPLAGQMGVPQPTTSWCARTATSCCSPTTACKPHARVPAGYLYVDGIVGDVGNGVLRDRRVLAEEGVVVVVVAVDVDTGAIITGPEVITRGWVYAPEAEDLLDQCEEAVADAVKEAFAHDALDIETSSGTCAAPPGKFVNEHTKRRPMIVPVVMEA